MFMIFSFRLQYHKSSSLGPDSYLIFPIFPPCDPVISEFIILVYKLDKDSNNKSTKSLSINTYTIFFKIYIILTF